MGRAWLALGLLALGVIGAGGRPRAPPPAGQVRGLRSAGAVQPDAVLLGRLDAEFAAAVDEWVPPAAGATWLMLRVPAVERGAAVPALVLRVNRQIAVQLYAAGEATPLVPTAQLPAFRGRLDLLYLPSSAVAGRPLYARVVANHRSSDPLTFTVAPLDAVLAAANAHERSIALAFGALVSLAGAALLIWLVLADRLFLLYAGLFLLQALYIVFLSGQGFAWPMLSWAQPLGSYAWNVPAGLSGAVGCLFTREIADLRHFSPRIYAIFGWLAGVFTLLTLANIGQSLGWGAAVHALGNLLFLTVAVFTVVVAFFAWRAGNRAAGWFLLAWGLLEGLTMTAAIRFLLSASHDSSAGLYYHGLPAAMVAAAVLIALGVADRLRQQRLQLTDAERRAQTDALTGVLNRRSLVERLDTACLRARARGLPIALLFIDLDHFKDINDSFGHAAGDACLRAIIGPMQAELRQSDVIGRYGGEEFVVILGGADALAARPIAERIRERVAGLRVAGFGAPIGLTCSIGIASSDMLGVWGENLLARADAAVYAAKRSGRNQVQIAPALAA